MADPSENPTTVARLLRTRVASAPIEVPVSGGSMANVISSGSVVTVESAANPRRGEIWLFVDDEATLTVHRVRHIDDHTVTARGSGNSFDDKPVPRDRLIGRVRQVTDARGTSRRFGPLDRLRSAAEFRLRHAVRGLQRL